MAIDRARAHLRALGMEDRVMEFDVSSATVELAARAVGCEPARIAKTLSFAVGGRVALVVAAGDARVDNRKFKDQFGEKASFAKPDELESLVGHPMGGVCPFAALPGVRVFLDESLRLFDPVYPAAGATNNAVEISLADLERVTGAAWVDICKTA